MTLLLALVIGALAVCGGYLYYPLVKEDSGVRFVVREGASFRSVVVDLQKHHIINYPFFLYLFHHLHSKNATLKAGEYLFPKGSTATTILYQIETGTGLMYYIFTIVPGWNFKQVKEALLAEEHMQHTIQSFSDHDMMAQFEQSPLTSAEGQFYPDSYYYTNNYPDIKVLKKAYKTMQDKLNVAWALREANLPYKNMYEALIAASLVEKEAHFDKERPIIAGVLINRLRKGMLLQVDPTVIYGLGARYEGKLYKKDLLDNNPYNTYLHRGLPPTPIAMPGMPSINAVLHPEKNNYLYYVARGDGYHQFSQSLSEHQAAIATIKQNALNGAMRGTIK